MYKIFWQASQHVSSLWPRPRQGEQPAETWIRCWHVTVEQKPGGRTNRIIEMIKTTVHLNCHHLIPVVVRQIVSWTSRVSKLMETLSNQHRHAVCVLDPVVHTVDGFIRAWSPNSCLKWTTCSSQCSPGDAHTHTHKYKYKYIIKWGINVEKGVRS